MIRNLYLPEALRNDIALEEAGGSLLLSLGFATEQGGYFAAALPT